MTNASGTPILVSERTSTLLPRAADLPERWLQELIHRHPTCLPMDEIEPGIGSLVPVCMELPLRIGSVGNLFINCAQTQGVDPRAVSGDLPPRKLEAAMRPLSLIGRAEPLRGEDRWRSGKGIPGPAKSRLPARRFAETGSLRPAFHRGTARTPGSGARGYDDSCSVTVWSRVPVERGPERHRDVVSSLSRLASLLGGGAWRDRGSSANRDVPGTPRGSLTA